MQRQHDAEVLEAVAGVVDAPRCGSACRSTRSVSPGRRCSDFAAWSPSSASPPAAAPGDDHEAGGRRTRPGRGRRRGRSSWPSTVADAQVDRARLGDARLAADLVSSDSGRSERVRSEAPCWKRPKSARPTWIRSPAVRCTPAAIESSATISATPIATPAAVSAVARPRRRSRFFGRTRPGQVTRHLGRLSGCCEGQPGLRVDPAMEPSRDAIWKALEQVIDPELRRPVTELDMVRDVRIDGGDVDRHDRAHGRRLPAPRELRGAGRAARRRRPGASVASSSSSTS